MKRLSLCMIIKDEIEGLERCLDSVSGLVDEVVIVDTGSTDGSLNIVHTRADKYTQIEWTNHFADARNVSLGMATGEWVLVLDGDEVLAEGHRAIEKAIQDGHLLAAECTIRNDLGNGHVGEFWGLRLFRNHPEVKWTGRIHEQVLPDLQALMRKEPEWRLTRLPVRIDHGGYRPEVMAKKAKTERNIHLLKEALAELDPQVAVTKRVYLEYKLAAELGGSGSKYLFRAAHRLLEENSEVRRRFGLSAEVLVSASQAWCGKGDADSAWASALAAEELHPTNAMVLLVCGQAALERGSREEAQRYAPASRTALSDESEFHFDSVGHDIALSSLEVKLAGLDGATEVQRDLVDRLCQRHPGNPVAALVRLRTLTQVGDAKTVLVDGLQHMKTHGASTAVLLLCADAAEGLGMTDKAKAWRKLGSAND